MNTLFQRFTLAGAVLGALAALAHPAGAQQTTGGGGTIAGRVTDADGGPVAGERVTARSTTYVGPGPAATATTGADGRYTLHVDTQGAAGLFGPDAPPALAYTVAVAPGDQLYAVPTDRAVTLAGAASPAAAGVDFVVTPGPQITVHVHDALTGRPVPGVRVEYPSPGGGSAPGAVAGTTDAGGQARFRTHALNVNLQIRAGAGLQATPGGDLYKYFLLSPLQNAVWDVTLSDPAALAQFAWRGVALGPDGRPAPGARVRLLRAPSSPLSLEAVTDDAGRFTFAAPAAAPYDLSPQSPVLLAERGDWSAVASAPFEVRGGDITLRLRKTLRASVTGLVTDPDGAPLAGVPVSGGGYVPPAPDYGNLPLSVSAVTDASGRFTLSGLLPGAAWRLYIGGPPGATGGLWAYSQAQYPPPQAGDVMLPPATLAPGERRDIGRVVVLRADSVVAGRVVGPAGSPAAAPLAVVIYGDHTIAHAYPAADGTFRAEHLAREPLTLSVYKMAGGSYSGGRDSTDYVARLSVRAGDLGVRVSVPAQPAAPFPPVFTPLPPPPAKPMFSFDFGSLPHLAVVAPARPHGPAPSEAAAVRAAGTFLKRIGEPGAAAVQPELSGAQGAFPATWSLLTAPGPGLHLTLTRDTGMVVEATDPTAPGFFGPAPAPDPPGAPAPATLTQGQAMRRGATILGAAGIPREYTFVGASRLPRQWVLYWMMRVRGVPFPAGGSLTERLDDRTGRLLELRVWFLPPAPAADRERVGAAGAAALADALLGRAGVPPGADKPPFKLVVVANGAWGGPTPPAPGAPQAPPARVAWVVQRPLPARPPGAEVWVDAQTGAILGGLRPPTDPAPAAPASSP